MDGDRSTPERVLRLPRLRAPTGGAAGAGRRPVAVQPVRARRARARGGFEVRHDLEPGFEPGCPRACRSARSSIGPCGSAAGTRATSRACWRRSRELNRADVVFSTVDTVGHPARAPRAARTREAAGRVRGDRPSRAARAAPRRCRASDSSRTPSGGSTRSSRTAGARSRSCVRWLGEDGPRVEFVAVRRRHRALPSRSGARPSRTTSSRRGRPAARLRAPRRARAPAPGPIVPDRRVRRQRARSSAPCPANVRLEIDVPVRARARMPARRAGRRRSPCARTPTPVRRRRCCRRWRARSPSSSRGRRRSPAGYHLEDGVNCRLVPPGDLAPLEQAVTGVLDDDGRATAPRAAGSRDGRAPSHVVGVHERARPAPRRRRGTVSR